MGAHKVRKIDFVLYENYREKVIFRFHPRKSRCHSHNDTPPKKWNDVYKVYYAYTIFRRYKDSNKNYTLLDCDCDEESVIDEVAARCELLANGQRSVDKTNRRTGETYTIKLLDKEMMPIGYGVSWTIRELCDGNFEFILFQGDDTGVRFRLTRNQVKEFGEYLNECCEYMLAHGDPI